MLTASTRRSEFALRQKQGKKCRAGKSRFPSTTSNEINSAELTRRRDRKTKHKHDIPFIKASGTRSRATAPAIRQPSRLGRGREGPFGGESDEVEHKKRQEITAERAARWAAKESSEDRSVDRAMSPTTIRRGRRQ